MRSLLSRQLATEVELKVLNFDVCADTADLSRRHFERLIAGGEGPAIVHVSKRRRGVLDVDLEKWLLSRRHAAPGEAPEKK